MTNDKKALKIIEQITNINLIIMADNIRERGARWVWETIESINDPFARADCRKRFGTVMRILGYPKDDGSERKKD